MINDSHFKFLGLKVKDYVTGFERVATTLSFDLYGCIQVIVTPPVDSKGTTPDCKWFDINRVEVLNKKPVMQRPNFSEGYISDGKKGCADKPMPD